MDELFEKIAKLEATICGLKMGEEISLARIHDLYNEIDRLKKSLDNWRQVAFEADQAKGRLEEWLEDLLETMKGEVEKRSQESKTDS